MNKIQTAARLLRQVAKKTTDATAFKVTVKKFTDCQDILLTPDRKRRGDSIPSDNDTFFHASEVSAICSALGLPFYIQARREEYGATFEVRIYEYNYGK